MVRILFFALLAFAAWKGYEHFNGPTGLPKVSESEPEFVLTRPPQASAVFSCDGRTHCSQMTSCAEATYFLQNCPGVKMDGNNDGVPCEQQWCR